MESHNLQKKLDAGDARGPLRCQSSGGCEVSSAQTVSCRVRGHLAGPLFFSQAGRTPEVSIVPVTVPSPAAPNDCSCVYFKPSKGSAGGDLMISFVMEKCLTLARVRLNTRKEEKRLCGLRVASFRRIQTHVRTGVKKCIQSDF